MADPVIVRAFSVLHDCMRVNEHDDPAHGERASDYASRLRGYEILLNDDDFAILDYAIRWHTEGDNAINETVAACWDADRLDLKRLGIRPDPARLFTQEAKRIAHRSDYDCLENYVTHGIATHPWPD